MQKRLEKGFTEHFLCCGNHEQFLCCGNQEHFLCCGNQAVLAGRREQRVAERGKVGQVTQVLSLGGSRQHTGIQTSRRCACTTQGLTSFQGHPGRQTAGKARFFRLW